MEIQVSIGEAVDKLSILQIKLERIHDFEKLQNISKEFDYLKDKLSILGITLNDKDYIGLYEINKKLWNVEDIVRILDKNNDFGDKFISEARSIYRYNEERSKFKRNLDIRFNSNFTEEKQYAEFE